MTSLLRLDVPVPVGLLQFEQLFDGDTDRLLGLSSARRQMQSALGSVGGGDDDDEPRLRAAALALNVYRPMWQRVVHDLHAQGARATTRTPFQVEWRWAPDADGRARSWRSTALATESIALALAEAVLEQRLTAVDGAEASVRARRALEGLLDRHADRPPHWLSELGRRARQSPLESPARWRALHAAVGAQERAREAIGVAASSGHAATVAAHFFGAANGFREAVELTPTAAALRRSQQRVTALAHRYTADALVVADHAHGGLAVALARQAASMDAQNQRLAEHAAAMERRNQLEFGMRTVPQTGVRVTFRRRRDIDGVASVDVSEDEPSTIIVHL